MGTRQDAFPGKRFVHLVVDGLIVVGMMSQTEADSSHHRDEMKLEHPLWRTSDEGRYDDQQPVFARIGLTNVVDNGDMRGQRPLQIVRSFVADLHEQCRGLTVHEGENAVVHVFYLAGKRPVETFLERIERPETSHVALCGDDGSCTEDVGDAVCQLIGAAHMSAENRDGVRSDGIHAHNGRVGMLVLDKRRDGTHADAHGTDEDKGVAALPLLAHFLAVDDVRVQLPLQQLRQIAARRTDLYDGCFHFSGFMYSNVV